MVAGLGEPGGGRETNHDLISGEKVVELLQHCSVGVYTEE